MRKRTPARLKGFQKEDGTILPVAYFDGYAFGDTLLEGVIFEARVTDGKLVVTPTPDAERYLADLNRAKWLKEATRYAQQSVDAGLEFQEKPGSAPSGEDAGEDVYAVREEEK